MLSIEKTPQDPPCCGLKSSSDERDSHKLDLLTLDLVDNDNNPLPKFSIRDYVFCTRSRDITANWPFSQRSLEVCLKHGLKELLPPFHSADAVRNPSLAKFNGQIDLIDNKNACNSSGKGSSLSDNLDSVCNTSGGDPDQFLYCSSENPSVPVSDKELHSTTQSLTCSNMESVPTNYKGSCLEPEASALAGPSIDKSEAVLQRAFKKRESINQSSKKKCRMIVKLSNMPHPSTKQDTAVNAPMVSEAMAVCPVCRVFSSSSNTTLNAHMDQCLAGESTTKWLGDSKLIKHRIKPKRMRLMVDIYKTAAHFTLEDLDRRNGTSWASNLCLPVQEVEMLADHNKQQLNFQETISEGPVYIDANGTKLRILSKSSDLSMDSKGLDDPQPRKHTKGDSETKFLLATKLKKKKKNQIQKQHNVLKHPPPGKKKSSEINKHQDGYMLHEETNAKEECKMKQLKDPDQVKFSKTETIRGWVCSKRTGLARKINGMVDHPRSGEFVYGNLRAKHNSSSSGNCEINQQSLSRSPNGYPSSRRIDMPPRERCDESGDQPSVRKRMTFSMVESPVPRDRTRSLAFEVLAEHGINQSSNDDTSLKDRAPSVSKRKVTIKSGPYRSANHPAIKGKLSTRHHSLLSKSRKLSSLRKKLQPATAASAPNSDFYLNRKSSATKKPREFHMSESNKEVTGSQSQVGQFLDVMRNPVKEHIRTETAWSEESMDASVVRHFKRSRGRISRNKEEAFIKTSRATPIFYLSDAEETDGTSMFNGDLSSASDTSLSAEEGIDASWREEDVDLSSEAEVEGLPIVVSSNSLNHPGFNGMTAQTDAQCHSQRSVEELKEDPLYEAEAPMLSSEADIFCATVTPESMMAGTVCMMVEMDSSEGKANYMDEVDAIPIPGPPGSFLPSPGRMDSDDLQGNSSLTSSRFQCSAECQELVDHSSESPAAISTTSTPTQARPGSNPLEKSSAVGLPMQDTLVAYPDFVAESCLPVPKENSGGTDMLGLYGLRSDIGNVSEVGSYKFRTDQQCCSRRGEGLFQNVALNYQDSQLLRRRTMGSTLFCSEEIQMNGNLNMKSSSSERSPVHVDNDTTTPAGHISLGGFVDTQVGDYESVGPATPVLRLMGKNLMVINKDENASSALVKPFQSSSTIGHAVSQLTSESCQNVVLHKVPHLVSQGAFSCNQTETCDVHRKERYVRWSKGVGTCENLAMPQTAYMNPAMFSTRSIHTGGYSLPNVKVQPPSTYDMLKLAEPPNVRCKNADSSANTIEDGTRDSEVDSTTISSNNDCIVRKGAQSPVSMPLSSDTQIFSPYYLTQRYKDARYSGIFLFDAKSSIPSQSKWNQF